MIPASDLRYGPACVNCGRTTYPHTCEQAVRPQQVLTLRLLVQFVNGVAIER